MRQMTLEDELFIAKLPSGSLQELVRELIWSREIPAEKALEVIRQLEAEENAADRRGQHGP